MMLAIIAWRNVWRSKGRSFVVIGAMVVGIWALSFGGGFMQSFMVSYIQSAIKHETSNIQLHHPDFSKDNEIKYVVDQPQKITDFLRSLDGVKAFTTRTLVNGMISSSRAATGVKISGVNPENEASVTELDSLVADGEYFEGIKSNPVLIGDRLAEKLKVKVKSKVVLTFQDKEGNITAGRFRVAGILHATSLAVNEGTAYVLQSDINRMLLLGDNVHEIAITTKPEVDDQEVAEKISNAFPGQKVETWREISPALVFIEQWLASSLLILICIIMAALAFGIVNTMLMAVLERVRELGMLMALGMKRQKVYVMIMIETIYLSIVGGPIGLAIGYLTVSYFGRYGLDLSDYSEGLEAIGYESILYPQLGIGDYTQIVAGVLVTAILAALYPAWKAIRLNPVEALHTV
jgi:putative ABC transport system permease protein